MEGKTEAEGEKSGGGERERKNRMNKKKQNAFRWENICVWHLAVA